MSRRGSDHSVQYFAIVSSSAVPFICIAPSPQQAKTGNGSVVVDAGKRVSVPSFEGQSVRGVIEKAGHAGLGVQVVGNGIARTQVPPAGTLVPEGTAIVVRFTR